VCDKCRNDYTNDRNARQRQADRQIEDRETGRVGGKEAGWHAGRQGEGAE